MVDKEPAEAKESLRERFRSEVREDICLEQ